MQSEEWSMCASATGIPSSSMSFETEVATEERFPNGSNLQAENLGRYSVVTSRVISFSYIFSPVW